MTVREIEADGVPIDARIPILKFGTGTALATAKTTAYALEQFIEYFTAHRPDMVLVLGGFRLRDICRRAGGGAFGHSAGAYFRRGRHPRCRGRLFPPLPDQNGLASFPSVRGVCRARGAHGRGARDGALRGRPWRREHPQPAAFGERRPCPELWALRWRGPMPLSPITPKRRAAPAPPRSSGRFCARWESFAGLDVIFTKSNGRRGRRCHQRPYRRGVRAKAGPVGCFYKPWRAALPFGHEVCDGCGG